MTNPLDINSLLNKEIGETMGNLNKDFYDKLPSMVCEQLDNSIIPKLGEKKGFNGVWEEYRQHILTSNRDDMKMPYSFFKKVDN